LKHSIFFKGVATFRTSGAVITPRSTFARNWPKVICKAKNAQNLFSAGAPFQTLLLGDLTILLPIPYLLHSILYSMPQLLLCRKNFSRTLMLSSVIGGLKHWTKFDVQVVRIKSTLRG